jgi:enoyl-CoA hydratase
MSTQAVQEQDPATEVQVHPKGPVLVMTLSRPRVRNAVNPALAQALSSAMQRLDAEPALRVGVLTGAGGHFCSGMDLKAFTQGESPFLPGRGFAGFAAALPAKPLIAAVEGYAVAGGFEIALACDLLVASRSARFGLPEVKRGLAATAGGLMRLPARVPRALAMELALTGRTMDAAEAQAAGLLNRLVEPGEALAAALALAQEIAANAPLAVLASKRVLREARAWDEGTMFERQEPLVAHIGSSADALEGARAFVEKRAPVWSGR